MSGDKLERSKGPSVPHNEEIALDNKQTLYHSNGCFQIRINTMTSLCLQFLASIVQP